MPIDKELGCVLSVFRDRILFTEFPLRFLQGFRIALFVIFVFFVVEDSVFHSSF